MDKEYICPMCNNKMDEEEGLYWCDGCGINNKSSSYISLMEQIEEIEKDFISEG